MKKGWEYKTLGEISNFISDGDWIEKKDQSLSGIRLIQTGNIGIGEYKDKPNNAHYISEDTFNKLKCTEIFKNDILISRLPEPLGRSCIMPDLNIRMITAVDCSIVRLKEKIIIPKWFIYYTMSNKYFRQIKEESSGTTRQRITRKKLEKFLIPISDISEQRRIVSYLDSSFDLIDKIKDNASKSLSEAKALFQSALAEAMEPKEGWEEKTLGEISTLVNNINWKKEVKSYNYIDLTSVDRDTSSITNTMLVNNKNAPSRAKQIVKKGDILFATTRPTLKRVAIIDEHHDNDICSTGFCVIRPINNSVLPKFVFYVLKNEDFYYYIEPLQTGASYPAVTNNIVKQYRCYIPTDIKIQQQIVSRLDSLSSKVRAMEEKYQKMIAECDALKQAMLREVFE